MNPDELTPNFTRAESPNNAIPVIPPCLTFEAKCGIIDVAVESRPPSIPESRILVNTNIFEDLGIDFTTALSDPHSFDEACKNAAEELRDILRANQNTNDYLKSLKKDPVDDKSFPEYLKDLYEIGEEIPLSQLSDLADKLRKLAKEIDDLAFHRATHELLEAKTSAMSKTEAHHQYTRLREVFNPWADMMKSLSAFDEEPVAIEKLPAMPGNYGSEVSLVSRYFIFDGETDHFMSPYPVCKRLGIEARNVMDLIDYIEQNPDCGVTVKVLHQGK